MKKERMSPLQDLIGKKFFRLTVIDIKIEKFKTQNLNKLVCQCECGNIKILFKSNLIKGNTKSCGCYKKEERIQRDIEYVNNFDYNEYIGKSLGSLTIIEYIGHERKGFLFKCQCSCGKIYNSVTLHHLMYKKHYRCYHNFKYLSNKIILNRMERIKFRYSKTRSNIIERDNKKCYICNSKEQLHVHHIESWEAHKDKRYDEKNLITLCRECHLDIAHSGYTHYIDLEWKKKFQAYTSRELVLT
jgi:hypothetical protein